MPLIADAVIHAYNFDRSNYVHERYSRRFAMGTWSHHKLCSPDDPKYLLSESAFLCDFDEEDVAAAVVGESPVDIAACHATPIFDFFRDGLVSMAAVVEADAIRVRLVLTGPCCVLYFQFADDIKRVLEPIAEGRDIDVAIDDTVMWTADRMNLLSIRKSPA